MDGFILGVCFILGAGVATGLTLWIVGLRRWESDQEVELLRRDVTTLKEQVRRLEGRRRPRRDAHLRLVAYGERPA